MVLGFSRGVCMQTSSQYPRLVTPVRLVKHLPCSKAQGRNVNKNNPPSTNPPEAARKADKSTRIQFDDQRFVDVSCEFVAIGDLLEGAFGFVGIHFHPRRNTDLL